MNLTIGVSALIITLLCVGVAVRLTRNERLPGWIRDGFVGHVYLPIVTGILAVGLGYVAYSIYMLAYGHAPLLSVDNLYGVLLAVVLVLGVRWSPAKRLIFGPPTQSNSQSTVVPLPISGIPTNVHDDSFRPAA